MNPQSPAPSDLLEEAHLALLRGNLDEARTLLDGLVSAAPGNAPDQDLHATVFAEQAGLLETARLEAGDGTYSAQPAQTGSIWTCPVPDPASLLLDSTSARKWPKPVLFVVCLLAGMLTVLLPGRHHGTFHGSWLENIVFGLAVGIVLFI